MVASISSPADLVNLSLRRVGYKKRIGNLYDGSEASKVALDVFSETRDELLASRDWDFVERNIVATLLKSAPVGGYFPPLMWDPATNPSLPWFFEYAYPDDAIKIRAVRRPALFVLDFDPQPNTFTTENDNAYTPARKVVLCNVADATLVYTGQVTDLSTWDPDGLEVFAATLGRRLAPALTGLDAAKMAAMDESQASDMAMVEEGK